MILTAFLITVSVVFIIDYSGVVNELKQYVFKYYFPKCEFRDFRIKPLDCSLCMTFWCNVIILTILFGMSVSVLFSASVMAILSKYVLSLIYLLEDILHAVFKVLESIVIEFSDDDK